MRKKRIINGQKYFYGEQSGMWFPEYKEENGIRYKLDTETMTYIPLIYIDEQEDYAMGMWGKRRLRFIKEERPILYAELFIDGTLWNYLVSIDKKANDMEEKLLEEISLAEGVNAEMKMHDHLKWAAMRNGIKHRVREIIYHDYIYI